MIAWNYGWVVLQYAWVSTMHLRFCQALGFLQICTVTVRISKDSGTWPSCRCKDAHGNKVFYLFCFLFGAASPMTAGFRSANVHSQRVGSLHYIVSLFASYTRETGGSRAVH